MAEGGLLPPVILELKAKASEVHSELGKVKGEVDELAEHAEKSGSKFNKGFNTMAGAGKALAVGLGGAAIAVGGFAVEAATAGEKVDAQLRTAIKNAGGSMEELEPKISATDAKLRQFGYTNEQTNTALTTLTRATNDPAKAMQAMSVAADLARAKNIDLNTASLLVAKAMDGQTGPLKRMGIDLPVAAGGAAKVAAAQTALTKAQQGVNDVLAKYPGAAAAGAKGHDQYEKATEKVTDAQKKLTETQSAGGDILDALSGRVKGAASAYGDTLAGKMAAAKAQVDNIGEALGKRLIPIITSALGAASTFVNWLTSHTPILYTLAAIFGTIIVTAIGAYIAKLVMAAVESLSSFASMIAKGAVWAAETAAQIATTVASWALYAAEGIGRAVVAAATGFASMVAAGATWVAQMAVQVAGAIAQGAIWIAEHVAMAAVAIAQYAAIGAAATIAFIAENAASLGIIAVIALVVAAIVWLATHWSEAWGVVTSAASWAYNNVIKPVGGWIMDNVLHPIGDTISWLGDVWARIWNYMSSVVKSIAGAIGGVIGGIVGAIGGIVSAVQSAIGWFERMLGIADSTAQRSYIDAKQVQAANTAMAISKQGGINLSQFAGLAPLSKDVGGWIPGAENQPIPLTGHGQEYMLSVDMLKGRQAIDPKVVAAVAGGQAGQPQPALAGAGAASGGGQTINVQVATNADPQRIAADIGWAMRAMA